MTLEVLLIIASCEDSTIAASRAWASSAAFTIGNVPGDAARVHKLAIPPQHTRINQDVLDRAVSTPHPRFIVPQYLPCGEAPQNIGDDALVDMELRDVMAKILIGRITKKVQLAPIDSENDAVWPHPVHTHGGILEKIRELLFALAQCLFSELALGNAPKNKTTPRTRPSSSRIGAALSSIGVSTPFLEMRIVSICKAHDMPFLKRAAGRILDWRAGLFIENLKNL